MHIKRFWILLIIVSLFSCSQNKLTSKESAGVKNVVDYFGGICDYKKGIQVSSNGSKKNYFDLKLYKSEKIEALKDYSELAASGIAYIFCTSLENDKSNYDVIRSQLSFDNGNVKKYEYLIEELNIVKHEMEKVTASINYLKNKNYNGLKSLFYDSSYSQIDNDLLIENLIEADNFYGSITEFKFLGFKFHESESGEPLLLICGTVLTTKNGHKFSIETNPADSSKKVFYINYKY